MIADEDKRADPNRLTVSIPPGYDHDDPSRIPIGSELTYACTGGEKFRSAEFITSQARACVKGGSLSLGFTYTFE